MPSSKKHLSNPLPGVLIPRAEFPAPSPRCLERRLEDWKIERDAFGLLRIPLAAAARVLTLLINQALLILHYYYLTCFI